MIYINKMTRILKAFPVQKIYGWGWKKFYVKFIKVEIMSYL